MRSTCAVRIWTRCGMLVHRTPDSGINYIDLVPYVRPEDRNAMEFALEGRRQETILSAHFGIVCRNGELFKTRDLRMCLDSFEDLLKRINTDHVDVLVRTGTDGGAGSIAR